jgi:hypothetical protein
VDGSIQEDGPGQVERDPDRERNRSQPPFLERNGEHEGDGGNQSDDRDDVLRIGEVLARAGRGSLVLAGQPVRSPRHEEGEARAAEEREGAE